MSHSEVYLRWNAPSVVRRFRAGVSLHSHTMHSRENMAFLPLYVHGVPVLGRLVRQHEREFQSRRGRTVDYTSAWWTPPLPAVNALELESRQVEALGLHALVSLSDHDDIEAALRLALVGVDAAISLEWTVPFPPSFFHVGVHNLPRSSAVTVVSELQACTRARDAGRISQLLEMLHSMEGVLVVLNHPAWDEGRIGRTEHEKLLLDFIARYGAWLHAFELNGLRDWNENRRVMALAERHSRPAVSGGDRHGCEPNANINLTDAADLGEFVEEVRSGSSRVLFLNQYREPSRLRRVETLWDVLRDHPELLGREKWTDRVFYRANDGSVKPLSTNWECDGPVFVNLFLELVKLFRHRHVRSALRIALAEQEPAL